MNTNTPTASKNTDTLRALRPLPIRPIWKSTPAVQVTVPSYRDPQESRGRQTREVIPWRVAARDQANLPDGFRTHDLRHLRATRWLAAGAGLVKVKEALGHSSLATTMIYTHLVRENLSDLPGVQPVEDEREALKELA